MKRNNQQQPQVFEQKINRYAEDFIKHVSNVKRRSQNVPFEGNNVLISTQQMMSASIYEVPKLNPKRLDTDALRNENDNNKGDEMGNKPSEKVLLTHGDGKARNHAKATGTVPKSSSSISSNESKKKLGLRQRDKENDNAENLPKAKVLCGDEDEKMLSSEALSTATVDVKATSDNKRILDNNPKARIEQQKNIDDDDDEVFLETRVACDAMSANDKNAVSANKLMHKFLFLFFVMKKLLRFIYYALDLSPWRHQ